MNSFSGFIGHPTSGAFNVFIPSLIVSLTCIYYFKNLLVRIIAWLVFLPTIAWLLWASSVTAIYEFTYTSEWWIVNGVALFGILFAALIALQKEGDLIHPFSKSDFRGTIALCLLLIFLGLSLCYSHRLNYDKIKMNNRNLKDITTVPSNLKNSKKIPLDLPESR